MKNQKRSKNHKYNKKQSRRISGSLGGEIAELGYGNLEAAKNAIEEMYIWNQEELDMAREQLLKRKRDKTF